MPGGRMVRDGEGLSEDGLVSCGKEGKPGALPVC